jgi:hypothetical protein
MTKITVAIFCIAVLVSSGSLGSPPVSACNVNGNCGHNKGAPGPLAAAGLPFLAIGYGAYWILSVAANRNERIVSRRFGFLRNRPRPFVPANRRI